MDYLNEEKEDTLNLTINKEERAFTNVLFYRFIEKSNKVEDVSALHYAQSVEILFCENVTGQATIGTKVFNLRGKELFFIAPNVIHSTTYFSKKDSRVYVFQLSLEHLKPLFDVEQCFRASNKSLYNIREYISVYVLRFRQEIRLELLPGLPADQVVIPKFTLQPLVENAYKYCDRKRPKIMIGSRMILMMAPVPWVIIL